MSDCDCQKNIKRLEPTVDDVQKPIGDGLLITTVASTTVGIFYALRAAGVGQHNALITSTCWHALCLYMFYSVKDGLIITATTTGIFYALKAANVKPPKASLIQ